MVRWRGGLQGGCELGLGAGGGGGGIPYLRDKCAISSYKFCFKDF